MIHKLIFDTTNADTIADSHSVGAYLRSSDGTLITHTTVGGKEAVDVNVVQGIDVEVDLDAADDSVASWTHDGSGNAIGSTGGALHVSDAGGSITVDATDLDIRALTQSDEITVFQGTSPWVVSATDLDIRDLDAASDSVAAWTHDGSGNAIGSTAGALDVNIASGSLDVNDAALADTAIAADSSSLASANTAQDLVASPLASRKYLFVYNNDNREMYIGPSGVSASDGFPLPPGSMVQMRAGASVDIEWVSAKAGHDARYMELS